MKKLLLILVPVVLVAVGVLGALGIVPIPGISPKKKSAALAMYTSDKEKKVTAAKPLSAAPPSPLRPQPKPKVAVAKNDPELGAQALAAVWDEIPTPRLERIVKDWKEDDLARVLSQMDTGQVAKLLAALADTDPKRASNLSRVLQAQGAVVPLGDDES